MHTSSVCVCCLYGYVGLCKMSVGFTAYIMFFPPTILQHFQHVESTPGLIYMRSHRERGLHERAVRSGASLPCKISNRMIPMKQDVDSETLVMVSWPFLLPSDFAPWLTQPTFFFSLCVSSMFFSKLENLF